MFRNANVRISIQILKVGFHDNTNKSIQFKTSLQFNSFTRVCFVQDEDKKNSVVEGSSTDFVWLENQREARLVRQRNCMLSLAA